MDIKNLAGEVIFTVPGDTLEGAYLEGANLVLANLRHAVLVDADMRRADMRHANLQDANLQDANLQDANLEGANLAGANLEDAYLEGAYLKGANLKGSNLKGANLVGAYLRYANLEGANLRGANLVDAAENKNTETKNEPAPQSTERDLLLAGMIALLDKVYPQGAVTLENSSDAVTNSTKEPPKAEPVQQPEPLMTNEQAFNEISRHYPCAHENIDTRLGDGRTWAKCEDCGATFERSRHDRFIQAAKKFEDAIVHLRSQLDLKS